MTDLQAMGQCAVAAKYQLQNLTTEEKNDAFADGVSNNIDRRFLELAKKFDKKKVLSPEKKYIHYDSFENLEINYEGKMPLYFAQ